MSYDNPIVIVAPILAILAVLGVMVYHISTDKQARHKASGSDSRTQPSVEPKTEPLQRIPPTPRDVDSAARCNASPSDGKVGVFVNYRRQDEASFAGRLADRLVAHLGIDNVFIDVDSIDLGADFNDVISESLGSCQAMIVVIGKRWLRIADAEGRARLSNPDDYVRIEIERALTRNIRLIPVLVDGASIPRREELPKSMESLTRRNGLEMSHASFNSDADRLIKAIDRIVTRSY